MASSGPVRQGAFISYARLDGEAVARALQERLRIDAPDVPTWLDRLELEGGVGWWSQIERELDRVEFLIVVMTPAAMQSANTRREWRAARQRGVCVYPVKGGDDASLDYASLPGWMQKAHFYDPRIEWPKFVAHLRRGCRATRVPFMAPALSARHVERPRETGLVLQALLARDEGSRPVALRGGGGYGKTTLAAALCHQDAVIEHFDDGILWVTLGQSPNLLNELIKLYAALTGERPGFVDAEDASLELASKLEGRNCLIVIDDVWKTAHAAPFLRGGPGCMRLVTTRLADVVPNAQRIAVEQMSPDDALDLLLTRIGIAPADRRPFEPVVARLDGWPLPIKLAGSVMRQRIERGDSETNALAYVLRALDKRGIVAFDDQHSDERTDAVGLTLEASLGMLGAQERRCCAELAVFAEDDAVPMAVAATLWQLDEIDAEDLARRLDDHALIEFDLRHGTLQLHDILRGYLAAQLADAAAIHAKLLEGWGDPAALPLPYAWRRYAHHMRAAGRGREMNRLLLDFRWLEAKLRATDVHALIADADADANADADADAALAGAAGDLAEASTDDASTAPARAALRDALRLSAAALAADPGQLRTQLLARLAAIDAPSIADFRQAAIASATAPWLRLRHATLDAPGGLLAMTLVGHERGVTALAVDGEFERLVSGSDDATARLWACADGRLVAALSPFRLGVRGAALFAGGKLALIGSADGRVGVMDLESQARIASLAVEDRSAITALAVSADGSVAVCASRDGKLRVWNLATRELVHTLAAHRERIASVAVSASGHLAVSGAEDGLVRVWNLETGVRVRDLQGHADAVNGVALSGDGRQALSASSDRSLIAWDVDAGVPMRTFGKQASGIAAVAMTADGRRAVSGSHDGSAHVWDLDTGTLLAALNGHTDAVRAVVIDAGGTRAATGSADRSIKLWRLDGRAAATAFERPADAAVCVVLGPDGTLCAAGTVDGRIVVHDMATWRLVREIAAHAGAVLSLAFTDDASCLLSGDVDGIYCLWVIDTGERFPMPVRHLAPIIHCAYSPAARFLVTAGRDQFVYLWDVPAGVLLARYGTRRLFDHLIEDAPRRCEMPATDELLDTYLPGEMRFEIVMVGASADGRFAVLSATAREPGSLRVAAREPSSPEGAAEPPGSCLLVFEIATGEIRSIVSPQADPITAFAIDAAGTRVLWARSDHALELWDLKRNLRLALLEGHGDKVNAIAFGTQADRAYSCGKDRSLRVWDLASGGTTASMTADAALRSIAVGKDGQGIVVADAAGRMHVLDLEVPSRTAT